MLLMVKKTYVMLFIVMWKLVTITWKVMINESSYLKYWDVKSWMDGQCLRDLGGFKWVEEISQFNKNLIKSYNDDCDEGSFLDIDIQYQNLHDLHHDLPFFLKEWKLKQLKNKTRKLVL